MDGLIAQIQSYIAAHPNVSYDALQKCLAAVGALSLATQALPRFVAWAIPAATKAADFLAKSALNSPARPLILWKANEIISFLCLLKDALNKIISTFTDELAADIQAEQTKAAPTPTDPKSS